MKNMNRVKDIVVVGGGTAGWMCASALAKSFGVRNHTITLVESDQIGTVGVGEATIPVLHQFLQVLGLDENEFVKATNATFKLGIEFVNWKTPGHRYFHPFGNLGVDMDGVPFGHFWLRWNKLGGGMDFSRFNAETEAAREKRFARAKSSEGPKVLPDVNYAFQFDASLFAKYLRGYAEERGVVRVEGKVLEVKQDPGDGCIEELRLDDGRGVSGDLFIDCTGFRGLLIEEVYSAGYDDWSQWLPVNRAAAVPCEKAGELLPYTRSIAHESGWRWRIPLQHRTGNGHVFCDNYISEDEAVEKLMSELDGMPLADPKVLRFVTGVRKKNWIKNCIAIGLSGGFIEPLESTSIHLIQRAIWKILAMFPQQRNDELMAARFNADMRAEYEDIRDFIIAHYKVTEREDTPFWKYVKNMAVPDSLATKIACFRSRGEILVRNDDLFKEVNWFVILYAQGIVPQGYHPVANSVSEDELKLRLTKIRSGIKARVESLPSHEEYIRQNCASPMMKM